METTTKTLAETLKEKKGFVLTDGFLKETTFLEFIEEFCSDETTTPDGVAPRTQTRAIAIKDGELISYSRYIEDLKDKFSDDEEVVFGFGIFTYRGPRGNYPFKWHGDIYETEDLAEDELLKLQFDEYQKGCTDAEFIEEADVFNNLAEYWEVSEEVAKSIFQKMLANPRRKDFLGYINISF